MCYYVMYNPAQTHFIASWQEGLQKDAEGKVHLCVIMSCSTQLKPLY